MRQMMTGVAPELAVDDMAASLAHYEAALHLYRGGQQALQPQSIHVFVDGLDDLFAELSERGARVIQGIIRKPWGNREFRIVDPSGNMIKFTEPHSGQVSEDLRAR